MEKEKYTYRQSFMYPDHQRYKWVNHPNNNDAMETGDIPIIVVPMDVDPPVFTRINRAYTETDKNRFKQEEAIFFRSAEHMARNCPVKKQQF